MSITAEKVTAAAKSSATFNAPRISRCGEDASVLRRDAEPPAERAAETRVLAKTLPGALQRCKGLSRAGNVHTCSTGKVLAVSTFQGSVFPRHKKKERSGTVQKHRGSRRHCAGKLGGAFWEYFSFRKNRLWSSRFQIPRLAPDFGELDSFQKPAQAIQNPDSAPRRGFWNLDRFQDPDIAMQNPDYAPRPAIWKLKDKIQIPNSETAVSVYAPALTLHPK